LPKDITIEAMTDLQPDLSLVSEALQTTVESWFAETGAQPAIRQAIQSHPAVGKELPRVLACSKYVAETLARYPYLLTDLLLDDRLHRPLESGEIEELFCQARVSELADDEFQRQLRLLRHRELIRIAWRDLTDAASVDEILVELSALADAAICAAVEHASEKLVERYGEPRSENGELSRFAVLGMGKLGGRELNFSSDVDLIFLYSESGETDGSRVISNEQFFHSLGRAVVANLSNSTSDGFVYRVDVRLRPFGDSGPLSISLSALEAYLQQHGRDWERYAYVKARVLNVWPDADYLYRDILRPFVYRRYLDYGVFTSLREMKAMIEAEVRRREFQNNIKLGPGGIREIEFIVQSLQLVRGGTVARLQERELLKVLPRLVSHDCLPQDVATDLADAYRFLRRLENRLQAISDRQTHDLPEDEGNRARLTLAMNSRDWTQLEDQLAHHRSRVASHFRNIMFRSGDDRDESESSVTGLAAAWNADVSSTMLEERLLAIGMPDSSSVADKLRRFRESGVYRRMDELGRQRLDILIPSLIMAAAKEDKPDQAVDNSLLVIEAIGRRSAYFSLLNENPPALERLVSLCSMSAFLARQVAAHPLLLDELLDQRIFLEPPVREDMRADLEIRMSATADGDAERKFDALRNFQQAAMFRIAVADLSGSLPLMKVSDRLTDIAELVLQAALELSLPELTERFGQPRCRVQGVERDARFAIVAYGKMGGLELGYGSDLDLVFLHDSEGEAEFTRGASSVENAVFFARLTRKIIHVLTMPTPSGRLYEVDTRLRPSGKSGLLVSSLSAFDRYQREDAWTWEHQALLRSRAVAGDPTVIESFEVLRKRVLTEYVRRDSLRDEVAKMRLRMRQELCRGTDEEFDIKQDRGGNTDIEFIVQYLVLREAASCPELLRWSDNIRQLESLADHGLLGEVEAEKLADIYRAYRSRLHHLSLAGQPSLVARENMADSAAVVTTIWDQLFGSDAG
jgi:glutamate-ammonia-ligase adenylyltransferase